MLCVADIRVDSDEKSEWGNDTDKHNWCHLNVLVAYEKWTDTTMKHGELWWVMTRKKTHNLLCEAVLTYH